jgi:RND family efflux transporter MFP subunit
VTEIDLNSLKIDRTPTETRRSGRRRGRGFGAWIALALLLGAVWIFRAQLRELVERFSLPEVRITTAIRQSGGAAAAVSGAAANGYVVASRRAALSADTPGRIVEMNVTEGSVVKKGDIVARLFSDEYRAALRAVQAEIAAQESSVERAGAQVAAAEAQLPRLEAEVARARASVLEQEQQLNVASVRLKRAEGLLTEGVGPQEAVDAARSERIRVEGALNIARAGLQSATSTVTQQGAELVALRAALRETQARLPVLNANREAAQATLDKTEVRAPFDGIVVLKDAEVGEVVSPNSLGGNSRGSVATMVDFATLEVQVELPETNLSAAVVGAPATIFLDAYPERPYAGRVERIWPTANRQKATVEVRVRFEKPDQFLRPEMGARIVFNAHEPASDTPENGELRRESAVLVPRSAVVPIDGKSYVFLLERDVARTWAVRLGEERGTRVVVLEGLTGGERLIDQPPTTLADGDRVRLAK